MNPDRRSHSNLDMENPHIQNSFTPVNMFTISRVLPVVPVLALNIGRMLVRYATKAPVNDFFAKSGLAVGGDVNNVKSETNRLEKTLSKFWNEAKARFNEETSLYDVCLDGKPLRTPLGYRLSIPKDKKQLAYLIGHEWDTLLDLKIKPNTLPLTSMASRATDLAIVHEAETVDPNLVTKVGDLQDIKIDMLRYLDTDTCLIFTTLEEYEGKLRQRQEELYRPLIAEYENYFTEYARQNNLLPEPEFKVKLEFLDCETDGLRGNRQSLTTQNIVLLWLDQLPIYDLVALEKAILSSKSFLCAVTILRTNVADRAKQAELYQLNKTGEADYYKKTVEELIEMANLETIFQTQEWGEVEDTHDVDNADWLRNLSSCALVCR